MQQYRAIIMRGAEKIQHCVYAEDRADAKERITKAYPKGELRVLSIQMLKNMRKGKVEFSSARG